MTIEDKRVSSEDVIFWMWVMAIFQGAGGLIVWTIAWVAA